MEFKGVYTAIVTPFCKGKVDYAGLKDLVELQIKAGVNGIVPVGTTGESPTLTIEEHIKVIETVISTVGERCSVIAGTGANSTAEAIQLTQMAKDVGAEATLQVAPYYNKPSQEGLYRHFSTICDECGLPLVLYNVPGRSSVQIAPETVAKLAKNPLIPAIKEAGGSAERVSAILDLCDITVLSGDDSLTLPMLSVGAKGIISVASNLVPSQIVRMVDAFLSGNAAEAERLHKRLYPLFRDLFIETNPGPVKSAMFMKGLLKEESYRLPLCPISEKSREVLRKTVENFFAKA